MDIRYKPEIPHCCPNVPEARWCKKTPVFLWNWPDLAVAKWRSPAFATRLFAHPERLGQSCFSTCNHPLLNLKVVVSLSSSSPSFSRQMLDNIREFAAEAIAQSHKICVSSEDVPAVSVDFIFDPQLVNLEKGTFNLPKNWFIGSSQWIVLVLPLFHSQQLGFESGLKYRYE